jgi:tripartite-type tricarboxylate transporter receptor subunit TctC
MKVTLRPIAVLLLAGAAAPGWAQGYPNKPVRILVGYAPGGGTDIMARAIGAKLTDTLKQQFVIENRPGANANIAAKARRGCAGGRLHDIVHVGRAHHEQARLQEPGL